MDLKIAISLNTYHFKSIELIGAFEGKDIIKNWIFSPSLSLYFVSPFFTHYLSRGLR